MPDWHHELALLDAGIEGLCEGVGSGPGDVPIEEIYDIHMEDMYDALIEDMLTCT